MRSNYGAPETASPGHPIWLLTGFWLSIVIAIAAVVRRLFALINPTSHGPAQMVKIDATFSSHAALTGLHIIPAAIFVIVAAWILLSPASTDWLDRLFFLFGVVTGLTAYLMSALAVGGWTERSAVFLFDTYFLFSLGRAYLFQLRSQPALKQEWMSRAVGILLGIATTRPVIGVFFATNARTHLAPNQFFGIAFWIGFSINAVVIELWLHSNRRQHLHAQKLSFV